MSVADDQRRFRRYCDGLTDVQLQLLHREVARRCYPIYRRVYAGHWEMGMKASHARREAVRT